MSAGPIAVFVGPSLERSAVEALLPEALVLPPSDQGSVFYVVETVRPAAIVLIDGVFGFIPAVRHKELLWALHRGLPVFGGASMGAIRAAELHPQGMIGHGPIYRWYRATPGADDAEVAVATAPVELGAQALSEALINMRVTLRRAERVGVIDGETRHALVRLARNLPIAERSWERLLEAAGRPAEPLRPWLPAGAVDQKRLDALSLIRLVAALAERRALPRPQPIASFPMTEVWVRDLEACGLEPQRPLDR